MKKKIRSKKAKVGGARKMNSKDYAAELALYLRASGLPEPVFEHMFAKEAMGRRWRLDIAYPEEKIGVELHGVGGGRPCPTCKQRPAGRHQQIAGFREDRVKMNSAALLGWIVIECSVPEHIKGGEALSWVEAAFELRRKESENDGETEPDL